MDWKMCIRFSSIENSLSYLERMAAKGWLLQSWHGITMVFDRCEPKTLRFAVDVLPFHMRDQGEQKDQQTIEEYVALYEEMGWHCAVRQGYEFAFYTENLQLPPPQTDPVAYERTLYKNHKNYFVVSLLMGIAMLGVLWSILQNRYRLPLGIFWMLKCAADLCIALTAGTMVVHGYLQMSRERRWLKNGQIPETHDYGAWETLRNLLLAVSIFLAAMTNIVGSGGTSITGWILLAAEGLYFAVSNWLPVLLCKKMNRSREEAIRWVRGACTVLNLVCTVCFTLSFSRYDRVRYTVDPQVVPPVITLEELIGDVDDDPIYRCERFLTEMYTYYDYANGNSLSYTLYLSHSDSLLTSFERSADGSGFSQARVDWDTAVTLLDGEALGVERAWYYEEPGVYQSSYHYFLRTEGAAVGIETTVELSPECLQELGVRLNWLD